MKKKTIVTTLENYLNCLPENVFSCVFSVKDNSVLVYTPNCLPFFGLKATKSTQSSALNSFLFALCESIGLSQKDLHSEKIHVLCEENIEIRFNDKLIRVFFNILDNSALNLDDAEKLYVFSWTEILEALDASTMTSAEIDDDLILNELEIVLNSIHDGVWIIDGNGITQHVNKALKRIANINAKDVIGKHVTVPLLKGDFEKSVTLKALKSKKVVSEFDDYHNGKRCLNTSTPILDEKGNVRSVVGVIRDLTELEKIQNVLLEKEVEIMQNSLGKERTDDVVFTGKSVLFREHLQSLKKVAKSSSALLLTGETGTGKTVAASFIHENSQRKDKPFIVINCAAIPESLIDSELFGYEKGSFTGASQGGKKGYFELADNGTLFLDEIAELPLTSQSKLLHVLDNYTFYKVGGDKQIRVDVRVIAATNRSLEELVKANAFRKDLYYRLNMLNILIPPLRERTEDIALLANIFLHKACERLGTVKHFHKKALMDLTAYNWPGNVRELRGAIEYFAAMTEKSIITVEDIHPFLLTNKNDEEITRKHIPKSQNLNEAVKELERAMILEALSQEGSSYKAAKKLGISQSSVVRKAHSFGIKLS